MRVSVGSGSFRPRGVLGCLFPAPLSEGADVGLLSAGAGLLPAGVGRLPACSFDLPQDNIRNKMLRL